MTDMETMEAQLLKRVFTTDEYETMAAKLKESLSAIVERMEYEDGPTSKYCSFTSRYGDDCVEVLPGVTATFFAEARQEARCRPATYWHPAEVSIISANGSLTELTLWDENEDCEIELPVGLWDELEKELNEIVKEG